MNMMYLFYPVHKLLCLSLFLHFSPALSTPTQCALNAKTVTFSSLVQFQGSSSSFNPSDPTYQGNVVDFNFASIDRLPRNSFISFDSDRIIKLTLNHKRIKTIEDGAFSGLFCLHYLELRHNNISSITEDVFQGLPNLQQLDLSENLFEHISSLIFRDLRNLVVLNLSKNNIRTINTLAFFNLTKLESLDLSFNKIRNIPSIVFNPLVSVKEIYLNNNYLGDIEPEKWTGLNNLELLNLADNNLYKFDPFYNFSFAGLKTLNLSGNLLTSLNVFNLRKNFAKLKLIDITENNWFCEDLEVINHELADSKIIQWGAVNCTVSGEYKSPTTEKVTLSTTPTTATTKVIKKLRDYSKEVFVQNGEILYTGKKVVENIRHVENILVFLFVLVVVFVIVDMSVRIGFCQYFYNRMTGRNPGYIDGNNVEHMMLMRHN
ncbi:hypothetical protein NQ314_020089 [Rhamnusium bicolor]|uniref:Uncharacterized protein n=1 Tax=Rhamnusium bicolor TaxID=1586634 RepID=A0AAV8WLP6_9CUCU|nr:hypothetical protein NQ314_020089 [Rhamnusium bicolor]